jgi:hypothetical protein
MIARKALPRRTFMKGIGATLALPLLEAMVPMAAGQSANAALSPRRLGFFYIPMGMNAGEWMPPGEGRIAELSSSLSPLRPHLDRVNVVSNLELRNAYTTGNHASSNCAFLSCVGAKRTEGSDYFLGTTVDQIAAQQIGQETAIPSLELGTDLIAQVGNCDNGYACVYQNNLSWASPTSPLPMEADPRVLFERLFGDGGTPEERQAELGRSGSILDWVLDDMARLERGLGSGDRNRIEEYTESIREVERRIQLAEEQTSDSTLPELERPSSVPEAWDEHVKLMFELLVLALQADMTRIVTFQLAREASTRTYPQIGVPEPHHPVSHHVNDPEKLAKLAKINQHHVSLFADLLGRLEATPDGDGSGMGNPDIHDHSNLPIIVAGGGGRNLAGGRHIKYAEQTPLANLHLSLLDNVGVHLDSFVDSTGRADEVIEPVSL